MSPSTRGEPLSNLLEPPATLSTGRLVGIVCQVLEGLLVAHEAGIIHRDVKPDNIFIAKEDRGESVRLLDFGISKFTQGTNDYAGTLTSDGAMMGTTFYMSAEQASGARTVDERSDLYAVGVILYEGLAKRRPYEAVSLPALVIKIHSGDHVPLSQVAPDVAPALVDVVERAMHVSPGARYASARDLLAALVPFADSTYVVGIHTMKEIAAPNDLTLAAPSTAVKQSALKVGAHASERPPAALGRSSWVFGTAVAAVVTALVIAAAFVVGRGTMNAPSTVPPSVVHVAPPPTIAAPPTSMVPPSIVPSVALVPPPVVPPSSVAPPVTGHRPPHPPRTGTSAPPPPTTRTGHGGIVRDPSAFGGGP